MKISEQKQYYEDSSGTVSEINRGFNYGLIAIVWILCNSKVDNLAEYKYVLACIVASFIFDLFQYLWRTFACYVCFRHNEKKCETDTGQGDDPEVPDFPKFISVVTWVLFGLKIISMVCAAFSLFWKMFFV